AEDHTGVLRQTEPSCHRGRNGLRINADSSAMNMSFMPDLVVDSVHEITGDGESEAFAATRLRQDESVDPDHASVRVNQRPAAVARIDRSVGLNISHGGIGMQL